MRTSARWALAPLMAAALVTTGCSTDLAFRVDNRVKIISPKDRAEVSLPVTLEWTVRDFAVKSSPSDTGGSFAVFVDRSPVPPNKSLSWVARNDGLCRETPGCPDAAYLAKLGIYETTDTRLVITAVPASSTRPVSGKDRHRAVIILLDAEGKRIGEKAFRVIFDLKRKG